MLIVLRMEIFVPLCSYKERQSLPPPQCVSNPHITFQGSVTLHILQGVWEDVGGGMICSRSPIQLVAKLSFEPRF